MSEQRDDRSGPIRRAVALLLIAAAIVGCGWFVLRGGQDGAPRPASPQSQPPAGVVPPAPSAEREDATVSGQVVPLPSELPDDPPTVAAGQRRAAERVGWRFARDFLRFQQRKVRPHQIAAATDSLRAQIAALPRGRGTPAARQNPPRVVDVESEVADARTVVLTATVARLGARYPLRMTASRQAAGGRWVVSALQSETR